MYQSPLIALSSGTVSSQLGHESLLQEPGNHTGVCDRPQKFATTASGHH